MRKRGQRRRGLTIDFSSSFCLHLLALLSHFDSGRWLFRKRKRDLRVGRKQRCALMERSVGSYLGQIWIICPLRQVGQHDVCRLTVKAVSDPFSYVFIREVT